MKSLCIWTIDKMHKMHVIQGILDVQRNTKRKNQILRLLATTMPKIKINYVAIVSRDDMALEIRLTTR